jgi:hypothetical protein
MTGKAFAYCHIAFNPLRLRLQMAQTGRHLDVAQFSKVVGGLY